jgi:steroid delta-isomerase-like uncharacterized protein
MSTEENKATIYRLFEELNKGNVAIMDEVFADNFVRHAPDGTTMDKNGYKQLMNTLTDALPDNSSNIDDIVAEGDRAAFRFTWEGTHKGDLMGIPPTHKKISMKEAYFAHFENGKIVEYVNFMDTLSLMQQLGVSPPGQ